MKKNKTICIALFFIVVVTMVVAEGQYRQSDSRLSPKLLNYQGFLTDIQGNPITNPSVSMTFAIFDAVSAGNQKWTETQSLVSVDKGIFNVLLGSVVPIPDSVFTKSTNRWLELTVGGQTLSPRTRITSAGYAYSATYSDTALYARNAVADNDWTLNGNVLETVDLWGLARYGNVLYGNGNYSHVNFGIACTTGYYSQDFEYCTIGGGNYNAARFSFSTVAGGYDNTAGGFSATVAGGSNNTASDNYATVAGGMDNTAGQYCTSVVGGEGNSASEEYAFVGGGSYNTASGNSATVGGGAGNNANGSSATVAGGYANAASGYTTTVGGGEQNTAGFNGATVAGGANNNAGNAYTTVAGGYGNNATEEYGTIGGGEANTASSYYATVGGGEANIVSGYDATIGGGAVNTANNYFGTVSGGVTNTISGYAATVGGGYADTVWGDYGGVFAGYSNRAGDALVDSAVVVAGGYNNDVTGKFSSVGGGRNNSVASNYSSIIGGYADTIFANAHYSALFGINANLTQDSTFMIDMPHTWFGTEATGYEFPRQRGTNGQVLGTNASGQLNWVSSAADTDWIISGSNMYSGISGNVGIGTTVPRYKLDVNGVICGGTADTVNAVFGGVSSGYSNLAGDAAADTAAAVAGGYNNDVTGKFSSIGGGRNNLVAANYSSVIGGYADTVFANADYTCLFGINSNLTQDSTFMLDIPHVWFGTEATGYEFPKQRGTTGQVMVTDASGQLSWATAAAGADTDWVISGSDMHSGVSGNVGIGISAPRYKLDVNGVICGGTADTVNVIYGGILSGYSNLAGDDAADTAAIVVGGLNNSSLGKFTFVGNGWNNSADTAFSFVGCGVDNHSRGRYAAIGGGQGNLASGNSATVGGGNNNNASYMNATVGGGYVNNASGNCSFVGGGRNNTASGTFTTVAGGLYGTASANYATVGGGYYNYNAGDYSVIAGGYADTVTASGDYSFVFGINSNLTQDSTIMLDMPHVWFGTEATGYEFPRQRGTNGQVMVTNGSGQLNWATAAASDTDWIISGSDMYSGVSGNVGIGMTTPRYKLDVNGIICGGTSDTVNTTFGGVLSGYSNLVGNDAADTAATIVGGWDNSATDKMTFIGGGKSNSAKGYYAVVVGGYDNATDSSYATVGGGYLNTAGDNFATVTGGSFNDAISNYSNVSGGEGNTASNIHSTVGGGGFNTASGNYSIVSGGQSNTASNDHTFVAGGYNNTASGTYAVIGGGRTNLASGAYTTVGGGYADSAMYQYATVGGGYSNAADSDFTTIAGGYNNTASSYGSTVGGGGNNTSDGLYTTVSGGGINTAYGYYTTIGGGDNNLTNGNYSTVPGGYDNTASGNMSFAAGNRASAAHRGCFVWADSSSGSIFSSTVANQFRVRATGGIDLTGNVAIRNTAGVVVVELGEGLDYAEGFDVHDNDKISPGMVLTIDPENPGKLRLSGRPYDTKVAGITAGANSLGSGVRLGKDEFDCNVALAGRVYCNVDATEMSIEPGDLLTTSAIPGYAMKVTDYNRARGAILGKAMQKLEKGKKGQILVLVTLQ